MFLIQTDRWARGRHLVVALRASMPLAAIAPVWGQCSPAQLAKLTASDAAASDNLGVSIAISGDTVVVGSYFDDHAGGTDAGSAYVFTQSGGNWTQQAKLVASDASAMDTFGVSVAVFGDTAVVGARLDDNAGGGNAGATYIFVRSGTVWTEQAKLTASDAAMSDLFGASVAISDDTAVIGAYSDDNAGGTNAGAAYVFVRSGTIWTLQAKLTASDAAAGDLLGFSVTLSGDTAMLGAIWNDHVGGVDAGAAYVFTRVGGVWTQQAKLISSDTAAGDIFGYAVALSGETAVVGAMTDDHVGGTDAGSAYVFVRSGSVWTEQAKLVASDAAAGDLFGVSVGVFGGSAVIGAYFDDHAAGTDAGSAYVFTQNGSVWTQGAKLVASDAAAADYCMYAVAVFGDTVVGGAWQNDPASIADAGSAYVFDLGCITTSYCTAGTSTNVCLATMSGTGIPSASAASGFVLNCASVEGQKAGVIFYGVNGPHALPWSAGSTSFLCVKAPTQRTNAQNSGGTSGFCDGSFSLDWNLYSASHPSALGQPFTAGQIVWTQAWYRDPPAPKTTNLSDGLKFVMQP